MDSIPLVFVLRKTFFPVVDKVDSGSACVFHGVSRRGGDYLRFSIESSLESENIPLRILMNRVSSGYIRVPVGEVSSVVFPAAVAKSLLKVPKSMWRPVDVERVYQAKWEVPAIPPSFLSRDLDLRHKKWIVKNSMPANGTEESQMEFIAPPNAVGGLVSISLDIDGTGDEWDFTELNFSIDGVRDLGVWPVSWGVVFNKSAYAEILGAIHPDFFVVIHHVFEGGSTDK
jgi:hypothetical protein